MNPMLNFDLLLPKAAVFVFLSLIAAGVSAVPVPSPPSVAGTAYVLQDFNSGQIIAETNADERIEPASITKIMTAYVVFDAINSGKLSLDDLVSISEKAWRNPEVKGWMKGSRMFVEVGSSVPVSDLLRGLIIQSGNDASVALAEHIAGTEAAFVDIMNAHAQRLGLENTLYQNSTGWPTENHYTSARDIATLSRALIRDFPELYKLYSEKRFTYNNISQANRNALLWRDGSVDGIKTGHTEAAGYCLASSAERDGMRLIAVVMGTSGNSARVKNSQSLLNYGFRFYRTHRLFAAGEVLREARIWKGASEQLPLGLQDDLYVTIPRGEYDNLKPAMELKKSIFAPVDKQQALGEVVVRLNDEVLDTRPLIALEAVEEGNIFRRIADHIAYMLQ